MLPPLPPTRPDTDVPSPLPPSVPPRRVKQIARKAQLALEAQTKKREKKARGRDHVPPPALALCDAPPRTSSSMPTPVTEPLAAVIDLPDMVITDTPGKVSNFNYLVVEYNVLMVS